MDLNWACELPDLRANALRPDVVAGYPQISCMLIRSQNLGDITHPTPLLLPSFKEAFGAHLFWKDVLLVCCIFEDARVREAHGYVEDMISDHRENCPATKKTLKPSRMLHRTLE